MITIRILGEDIAVAPVVLILIVLSHHDADRHDHVIHTYRVRKVYIKDSIKDIL